MPAIDYKQALGNPTSLDHSNIEAQNMRVSKTIKMGLFTTNKNAVWIGDYVLSKEGYPAARVRFPANRELFRLQPGDVFNLVLPKYDITSMVCRVIMIEEESVESEKLIVTAIEEIADVDLLPIYVEPPSTRKPKLPKSVAGLQHVKIIEAPYAITDQIALMFGVGRESGNELGYLIYMSLDDENYWQLGDSKSYAVFGTLARSYAKTTTIDDTVGVTINFDTAQNIDLIQSISRDELYGTNNIAVIGNELITFQTILPITATQYKLYGVYRARWGSTMQSHSKGAEFYFFPNIELVQRSTFVEGAQQYFKVVPYSEDSTGSLSSALSWPYVIAGFTYKPYPIENLKAEGKSRNATYKAGETINYTWNVRMRGYGTGVGNPDSVVDAEITHEGSFHIKHYAGIGDNKVLKRELYTTFDSDATVFFEDYTAAEILSDNGKYPSPITTEITNYIQQDSQFGLGVTFESEAIEIVVKRPGYTTTTTTSTTTSSTTTSTTSTTVTTTSTTTSTTSTTVTTTSTTTTTTT